jgi:hypothetical protein
MSFSVKVVALDQMVSPKFSNRPKSVWQGTEASDTYAQGPKEGIDGVRRCRSKSRLLESQLFFSGLEILGLASLARLKLLFQPSV